MSHQRLTSVLALSVLLLTSCGSDNGGDGPVALSADQGAVWDLVWFSDSTGFGVAELWAASLEEEFGVEVVTHDYASGGLAAAKVLDWLGDGDDSLPNMKDQVAEAEIIVVYGNPEGSGATADIGTCVSTSTREREPPSRNSAQDWAPYEDVLTSIYETVFDLLDGHRAVVVAMDSYSPAIADWRSAGIEAECTASWEMMAQTVEIAAAKFDVSTVSMYDVFNGADHSEDPREKGYIGADGQHTTQEGRVAMIQALQAGQYIQVQDD